MRARMEQYKFGIPLYGCHVLLIRSTPDAYVRTIAKYLEEAAENEPPSGDGEANLLICPQLPPTAVIWLSEDAVLSRPYWIGVLAHECWHVVWRIGRHYGLERDMGTKSSGEAYAYLHGWLIRACMERLQPKPRRQRAGARKK